MVILKGWNVMVVSAATVSGSFIDVFIGLILILDRSEGFVQVTHGIMGVYCWFFCAWHPGSFCKGTYFDTLNFLCAPFRNQFWSFDCVYNAWIFPFFYSSQFKFGVCEIHYNVTKNEHKFSVWLRMVKFFDIFTYIKNIFDQPFVLKCTS